jgi:hypothetical protein
MHKICELMKKFVQIPVQPVETRVFFERLLVHVQLAVDFNLQTVPPLGWTREISYNPQLGPSPGEVVMQVLSKAVFAATIPDPSGAPR